MPSKFDALMQRTQAPLLREFGQTALLSGADDRSVAVILEQEATAVGDWGERMEIRWRVTLASALAAQVGDRLIIGEQEYQLTQLLDDDGDLQTFGLRVL